MQQHSSFAPQILDHLVTGVLFCDVDCIIRYVNQAYADILNLKHIDIVGKNISEVIPSSRAPEVLAEGKTEIGELCCLNNSILQDKNIIVNRIPVRNSNGEVIGMISQAIFSNSSELQRLSRKINNLENELIDYRQRIQATLASRYNLDSIKGDSHQMVKVRNKIKSYAPQEAPVLITGPTGTGKELVAHALHSESERQLGPLVFINCAAIPETLFESELFGYARGAFSGAHTGGKMGQVELADGGTLFLDEIGDMPMSGQAKMLRVLETKTICRVGDTTIRPVDFRLICATNRDLKSMIRAGSFREDLYYRINTFIIEIPRLADRKDDIKTLTQHFLSRTGEGIRFSDEVAALLCSYSWPGNIRELQSAVIHASSIKTGEMIELNDLPQDIRESVLHTTGIQNDSLPQPILENNDLTTTLANIEASLIKKALKEQEGNILRTASKLNISRATLYDKLNKYGIQR